MPGKPAAVFRRSPFDGENHDQYESPCPCSRYRTGYLRARVKPSGSRTLTGSACGFAGASAGTLLNGDDAGSTKWLVVCFQVTSFGAAEAGAAATTSTATATSAERRPTPASLGQSSPRRRPSPPPQPPRPGSGPPSQSH